MRRLPLVFLGLVASTAAWAAPADATRGQAVYQARRAACHSPDFNGVGPAHRGVFGRWPAPPRGSRTTLPR
jgi:cytochrome c